jgi:hypothetical protein
MVGNVAWRPGETNRQRRGVAAQPRDSASLVLYRISSDFHRRAVKQKTGVLVLFAASALTRPTSIGQAALRCSTAILKPCPGTGVAVTGSSRADGLPRKT